MSARYKSPQKFSLEFNLLHQETTIMASGLHAIQTFIQDIQNLSGRSFKNV